MTTDVLATVLRMNLAGAAAVAAVLALRLPARRMFGPELAYRLWAAPPLAVLGALLPARPGDLDQAASGLPPAVQQVSVPLLAFWAAGVVLAIAALALAQARFLAAARVGHGGPAVVGVIAPRIVMPADDGTYTEAERELIRAHEREHLARHDPRAGALCATLQALCWFNPLAHLGAHAMRLDQELACDAAVLRRRPRDRALYARTLLKTQLAAQALPFGCRWPASGPHPLEVRVGLLKAPVRYEGLAGHLLITGGLAVVALAAWTAQPPAPRHLTPIEVRWAQEHHGAMSVLLIRAPTDDRRALAESD
ncbi:MAG: peptidase M56 [Caulobacterales bacterium]|nr:peptidase M56 [Caulobacterales bacterium]